MSLALSMSNYVGHHYDTWWLKLRRTSSKNNLNTQFDLYIDLMTGHWDDSQMPVKYNFWICNHNESHTDQIYSWTCQEIIISNHIQSLIQIKLWKLDIEIIHKCLWGTTSEFSITTMFHSGEKVYSWTCPEVSNTRWDW